MFVSSSKTEELGQFVTGSVWLRQSVRPAAVSADIFQIAPVPYFFLFSFSPRAWDPRN